MNERELPTLNLVSLWVYYGFRCVCLFIFVITMLLISLVLVWVMPMFFKDLSLKIDAFCKEEEQRINDSFYRLSRKIE